MIMEAVYEDISLPTGSLDSFDMTLLAARITNNDSVVQKLHEQTQENACLKTQLQSFNESAIQINRAYKLEMEKSSKLELEHLAQQQQIKQLETKLAKLQDEQINDTVLHKQVVADLEYRLSEDSGLIGLCKQFIVQSNILFENNLMNSSLQRYFNKAVDILKKKGEDIPKSLHSNSKRKKSTKMCTSSTMTEHIPKRPESPAKTFCDRSTMHFPTTATRATSTSTFIQMVDVATNYPEPISIEEIFRQTICYVPPLIEPIDEFKYPTVSSGTQTSICTKQTISNSTQCADTMTRLKNVRRRINYNRNIKKQLLHNHSKNRLYAIKKEEESSANLATHLNCSRIPTFTNTAAPAINPQLSGLWQILGQAIFSIVGSGRTFDNSNDTLELISANLNQIRSVVEGNTNNINENNLEVSNEINAHIDTNQTLFPVENIDENQFDYETNIDDKCPSQYKSRHATVSSPVINQEILIAEETIQTNCIPTHTGNDKNSQMDKMHTSSMKVEPPTLSQCIERIRVIHMNQEIATDDALTNIDNVCSGSNTHEIVSMVKDTKAESTLMSSKNQVSDAVFKIPHLSPRRLVVKHKIRQEDASTSSILNSSNTPKRVKRIKNKKCISANDKPELKSEQTCFSTDSLNLRYSSELLRSTQTTTTTLSEPLMENVDLANITKYFDLPQLIEPILDLDLDLLLFGSSSDNDDSENEESFNEKNIDAVGVVNNSKYTDTTLPTQSAIVNENRLLTNKISTSADSTIDINCISSLPPFQQSSDLTIITEDNVNMDVAENVHLEYDSPLSPTWHEEQLDQNYPTIKIPLNSMETTTVPVIGEIIKNFSQQKHKAVEQNSCSHPELNNQQLFATLRNVIEQYLVNEWTSVSLDYFSQQILLLTMRPKILASCIIEILEDTDEPLPEQRYIPAPALPETHQKLIVLIHRLNDTKLLGFADYCSLQVERTLFTLSSNKTPLLQIINLTRLFIGINDTSSKKSRIRHFIYKCIYYFQQISVPMVFTVLLANPDCLPVLQAESDVEIFTKIFCQFDPIVQAIHIILMNTNYTVPLLFEKNIENYKKREMLGLLKSYYRYPTARLSYDLVITNLLDRLKQNNLRNVSYSLILIAKRNGSQWARTNLIDASLVPLLKHYMVSVNETEEHDGQIEAIIITIGSILKTFPITDDINSFYQIFVSVIESVPCHRQKVHEAAVSALLQTSRFGIVNIYQRICHWRPSFKVSRKLLCQLQTFVHRKTHSFWKK